MPPVTPYITPWLTLRVPDETVGILPAKEQLSGLQ